MKTCCNNKVAKTRGGTSFNPLPYAILRLSNYLLFSSDADLGPDALENFSIAADVTFRQLSFTILLGGKMDLFLHVFCTS